MLSAHFSLGFPEKGMAFCVHDSCAKAFPALPLGAASRLGRAVASGAGAGTGVATKTIAWNEKLEISLWATFFPQPGSGPLPALKCYSPAPPLASSLPHPSSPLGLPLGRPVLLLRGPSRGSCLSLRKWISPWRGWSSTLLVHFETSGGTSGPECPLLWTGGFLHFSSIVADGTSGGPLSAPRHSPSLLALRTSFSPVQGVVGAPPQAESEFLQRHISAFRAEAAGE